MVRLLPLLLVLGCYPQKARDADGGDNQFIIAPAPTGDSGISVLEERFTWATPKIDVLYMIDNSCSMSEEQALIADSFTEMIAFFVDTGFDYHVGVVSSDVDMNNPQAGVLRNVGGYSWVDNNTPNPIDVFGAMAQMGTSGSAVEKGRAAVYSALELNKNGPNAGFLRSGSQVAIVVLSDEEDQSGANPVGLNEFINWLKGMRPFPNAVSFSSIVTPTGNCPTGYTVGSQYLAVTDAIGGTKWSICDGDFGDAIDQVCSGFLYTSDPMILTELPLSASTIEVTLVQSNGAEVQLNSGEWAYVASDNSIRLHKYWPKPGEELVVSYVGAGPP